MRVLSFNFAGANFTFSRLEMHSVNPRNMVGIIRLCKRLNGQGVRAVYSNGILRYSGGKLKTDAHGRGRAFDLGGLSLAHPNIADPTDPNSLVSRSPTTKVPVAEEDFVIFFHWGLVRMLVDVTTPNRRRAEDGRTYRNDFDATPTGDRLLYRLSELPAVADRNAGHVMTDAHYERARDLFQDVYDFLSVEYSFRDVFLGPIVILPTDSLIVQDQKRQALADDGGAAGSDLGSVAGFVIHPDYPDPNSPGSRNGRQAHINHYHFNLGRNSGGTAGTYER